MKYQLQKHYRLLSTFLDGVPKPGTTNTTRVEIDEDGRPMQTDLARLRVGVPVTVTPVGSEQSYQGQIWQISPVIDPQTRQGEARVLVPYTRELRPGGFAAVEIRAGSTTAPRTSRPPWRVNIDLAARSARAALALSTRPSTRY